MVVARLVNRLIDRHRRHIRKHAEVMHRPHAARELHNYDGTDDIPVSIVNLPGDPAATGRTVELLGDIARS